MTSSEENSQANRWALIRDIAAFQVKLLLDGFRDLLLVPVSLVTGVISLINFGKDGGREFYSLLQLGKRSETWINLFGAADRDRADRQSGSELDMDEVVSRVENFLVEEYKKGGVTTQAKERMDRALDSISKLARRQRPDSQDTRQESADRQGTDNR